MARSTSTGTRSTTSRTRKPAEEAVVESTEATPAEVPAEVKETSTMSTDTVEPEATEAPVSDQTDQAAAPTEEEAAAKAAAEEKEKAIQAAVTEFEATVDTALADRDQSTGTLPAVQVEAVKEKYRAIGVAKGKKSAKKFLSDKLKDAVNTQDLILGVAVMALSDAVDNAGASPKPTAERKPIDPAEAFRDKLTVAHLAYMLVRENAGEGVDAEAEGAKVEEKVGSLTTDAQSYYDWTVSTAEDKGDEPTVDPLVKLAVKSALGKAATVRKAPGTSTPRQPSDGVRRNVRLHIAQAFEKLGRQTGEIAKVSELANAVTEEYPAGNCSPGAISAALKSERGVEGFELTSDGSGHAAARKI